MKTFSSVKRRPLDWRRPWRDDRFWVAAALLVAALIRLILLLQLADSPFGDYLGLDERYYHARALETATGDGPELPFFMSPLYQLALSGVYGLAGGSWWLIRVLQGLLGLGTLFFLWLLARRLTGRWWALGVLGAAVLYHQFFFVETLLLPTALAAFLVVLGTYMAVRHLQRPDWKTAVGTGAVFALAALTHGLLVVPAAAAGLYLFFRRFKRSRGRAMRELALLVGAALLVVAPVTVANTLADGDFVPLTTNGGLNLYLGNQPGAVGLYRPYEAATYSLDFTARRPAELEAAEKGEPPPSGSEVSRFWARRFWAEFGKEPWRILGLCGKRALLLLNGFEYPQVENFYFEAEFVPLLKWPWMNLYVLLPLGAAGLVLSRRKGARLLGVVVLAYALALLPFFVTARFRFPVIPLVIVGAGLFVERALRLIRLWRERRRKKIAAGSVITAAVLALFVTATAYRPEVARAYDNLAVGYNNLGTEAYARGDYAAAVRYQELALAESPTMLPARLNLGQSLLAAGDYARAEEILAGVRGSRLDPVRIELLIARAQRGRGDDIAALATLQRAAEAPFAEGSILSALSNLYAELGDFYHARQAARRAVELSPEKPDGYLALARSDETGAREHLTAGLARSELKAELLLSLGIYGGDAGRLEEAALAAAEEGNWPAWAEALLALSRLETGE